MTNDTRSPKEIEREIEEQRSDLTSNLEDLQEKFSIDTVVRQIGDQFREHGGDMGRSISEQVKSNPIPLALTGIGLAWMMFGDSKKDTRDQGYTQSRYSSAEDDFRRTRMEQGRPYVAPTSSPTSYDDGPSWSRDDADDGPSVTDRLSSGAQSARDTAAKGVSAVKDGASQGASAVVDATSRGATAVSDTASKGSAAVASGAKSAATAASDAAASAKSSLVGAAQSAKSGLSAAGSRIAEGTETLSEEGRKRVIAARQKALELRQKTARSAQRGADVAADFYDQQPLVVGALALAFGAALGGALPRTKTEDDLMGARSDGLYDEAERIFEEEKAKALTVAQSVKDEVKDIASETKSDLDSGAPGDKTAVEAIGDKAKSVADRVADKAKSSAEKQNLGKPKT